MSVRARLKDTGRGRIPTLCQVALADHLAASAAVRIAITSAPAGRHGGDRSEVAPRSVASRMSDPGRSGDDITPRFITLRVLTW